MDWGWKETIKAAVATVLLGVLLYFADLARVVSVLRGTNILLYLAAAAVLLSTFVFIALRWQSIAEGAGHAFGFRTSLKIVSMAYGLNVVFPGNTGDLLRSKIVERYEDVESHTSVLGVVGLERFLDVVSLLFVVFLAGLLVAAGVLTEVSWLIAPFVVVAGILLIFLWIDERYVHSLFDLLPRSLGSKLEEGFDGFTSMPLKKAGSNAIYSLSIWGAEAATFFLLAASLSLQIGFWEAALVTSVMSLASSLPLSPAGLGTVDAVGTGLLTALGVSYSPAIALVILQRSIGTGGVVVVGAATYYYETLFGDL